MNDEKSHFPFYTNINEKPHQTQASQVNNGNNVINSKHSGNHGWFGLIQILRQITTEWGQTQEPLPLRWGEKVRLCPVVCVWHATLDCFSFLLCHFLFLANVKNQIQQTRFRLLHCQYIAVVECLLSLLSLNLCVLFSLNLRSKSLYFSICSN